MDRYVFTYDDAASGWKKGDVARYLGRESESPFAPDIHLFRLEKTGELITLTDPFKRGIVRKGSYMAVETKKIGSMKTAQNALLSFIAKKNALERLKAEHGIIELEEELVEIKKKVTEWAVENEVEKIDLGEAGHATLIRGAYGGHFIGTSEDISGDEGRAVTPLRTLIYRKFTDRDAAKRVWFACTRRMPDTARIQNVINNGDLTVDEIAPAYTEKEKAPYLRMYG